MRRLLVCVALGVTIGGVIGTLRVLQHGAELWNLDKRIALFSWSTAKPQNLDSSRDKSLPRATITPGGR